MAQPVFDDHPLQEYFQGTLSSRFSAYLNRRLWPSLETGEDSEPMPGGLVEAGPSGVNTPPSALAQSILHAFSCLEVRTPRRLHSCCL